MYVHPDLKKKAYPAHSALQKIFNQADEENVASRDVRPLMSCLMRMPTVNTRLGGHILTRKTALSSFSWRISPLNEKDRENADKARARLEKAINKLVRYRIDKELYGVFCCQYATEFIEEKGHIFDITKRFRPVEIEQDGEGVNILEEIGGAVKKTPVAPEGNYIYGVSDLPDRGGILRSILPVEVLRYDMVIEWANFNRKLKGIIQGILAPGADDQRPAAEEAIKTAVNNNYIITDDLLEFKFNEITKAGSGQSFKELIESFKADIAIAVLGQANTSELPSGGGSRAALQILKLISSDIMYSDVIDTEEMINNQLVLRDFTLAWSTEGAKLSDVPWRFEFVLAEERNAETEAVAIREILSSGIPLKKSEVYERVGFSQPGPDDEVFESVPTAGLIA